MAYDEGLAERLREVLQREPIVVEKRMFGGLAHMVDGNLAVGVMGESLIVRVGPEAQAWALAQPGARAFDFTGKPMRGWVVVDPEGLEDDDAFESWVEAGLRFAHSLPPK